MLTEEALRKKAGATSFARGEDYVRYIHGLKVDGASATASIQARSVYLVDLDWAGTLDGRCTCPHHAKGNFCKHLVALGLAVLDDGTTDRGPRPSTAVTAQLDLLDPAEHKAILSMLAERYPEVGRLIQVRAAAKSTDARAMADELARFAADALRVRGFIDYRRSFDVARQADDLLDELEDHLDSGAPDVARPALLKAVTRLRTITLKADDSSGSIGSACQRAADLFARSCCEGNPDPVKLARWLVKFRDDSPGWPETTLAGFVGAFDDNAVATYRRAVAVLDQKHAAKDHWHRFEVDRMLLELADHDGDVDEAVRLLSAGDHADYAGIVDRLRRADRDDDAFAWTERAVAAGRVWVSAHAPGGRSYWLSPEEVADEYLARGRTEDALDVQRRAFAQRPEVPRFRSLIDLAERAGSVEDERARAFAMLDERSRGPHGSGAARIQIAIAERDLETAWQVAEELEAGPAWRELAGALAVDHPGRAAELHQPHIEEALRVADSKRYAEIAKELGLVRDLCERAGEGEDFAAYLLGVRERFQRRPSLMAALDRQGL